MSKKLSDYPNLLREWDYTKNASFDPNDFSFSSHKKVWWKCGHGHSWETTIQNRTKGTNCPVCAGKVIVKGFNDFGSLHPELLKEWAFDLNKDCPYEIACHSDQKYYWRCNKGHVWKDNINHRTYRNSQCPYCQNKKVLKGFNDFATLYPYLAKDWDSQKNQFGPEEVTSGSNKKVWWKCSNGHDSYQMTICNRTKGAGCPICNSIFHTSFPEQAILFYIRKVFPDAKNKYKDIFKGAMELDIYIPSKRVGIEYDGVAWHKGNESQQREERKYQICKNNGIYLYRIKEEINDTNKADKTIVINKFSYERVNLLENAIETIIKDMTSLNIDIDIKRDMFEILKYKIIKYEDSLAFLYPNVAKEWHPRLNGSLKPENTLPGTSLKVWWKCVNGHEWKGSIVNRTKGHGCDICAREQRKITYHNVRLQTRELLVGCDCVADWDYDKNEHTPDYYTKGSGEKVWWKCHVCGHEWKASIYDRTRDIKRGCPACSSRILVRGKNDLLTTNPDLAEEWDYEKNCGLTPSDVAQYSHKKVWWKCKKCGYSYQAHPSNRVLGRGCGCCAGRVLVPGINDLATTRPDIAIDWHPTKNGSLKPSDVTKGKRDMIWWKCHVCGNEWQDSLNHRNGGRGCPVCNKKKKRN